VFIRIKAPHRGLTSGGVTQAVAAAAGRAGLGVIYAHRLRHSAATAMFRRRRVAGRGRPGPAAGHSWRTWRDRHQRFHFCDQLEPLPDIGDLLRDIDPDPLAIFWDSPSG
jgi:hypothetical protein